MPIELQLLVWAAILALVQMIVAVIGAQQQVSLPMLASNRESMPALTGWALRAQRAHLNMLESLVVFAILVLVANATGRLSETTALGANLFFWGRLAYALVYLAGIPWLRTLIWGVSVAGLLLILAELF
ncbi:MAG TPA: MAPEG family protein [Sphingomicrobium sp.]|nr:MAPEG family protein [Sphingomicrobium sp.]